MPIGFLKAPHPLSQGGSIYPRVFQSGQTNSKEVGALLQVQKKATTTGAPRRYWAFDRDPRARIPLMD